jgi:hypothetical protein
MTDSNKIVERNMHLLRRHCTACNCIRIPDDISICAKCNAYKEYTKKHNQNIEKKKGIKIIDHSQQNTDHRAKSYVGPDHKICSNPECGKVKHITEFHKTKRKYEGSVYIYRHAKCNECRRADKRRWYANKKKNTTKK